MICFSAPARGGLPGDGGFHRSQGGLKSPVAALVGVAAGGGRGGQVGPGEVLKRLEKGESSFALGDVAAVEEHIGPGGQQGGPLGQVGPVPGEALAI